MVDRNNKELVLSTIFIFSSDQRAFQFTTSIPGPLRLLDMKFTGVQSAFAYDIKSNIHGKN